MNFEDSRFALFTEPNAYQNIVNTSKKVETQAKKVVFSEPYESLPAFYIDNNFKKGNCNCIPKPKPKPHPGPPPNNCFSFPFDFKTILPLLSGLIKGGNSNLTSILNIFEKQNNENQNQGLNLPNIVQTLISNGGLDGILNIFKPKAKSKAPTEDESSEINIKNYTRIE